MAESRFAVGSSAKMSVGSVTRAFSTIAGFAVIPRDQNQWRFASRDLSFFNCLFASLIPGELLPPVASPATGR